MSNAPVVSLNDELLAELESLAVSVKGWNLPHAFQEPEEGLLPQDWEWHVGQIDEEGNRYPVLNANAHQYDSEDSEKLARYYAACNRDTILALLAEREELKRDSARYRWLIRQAWFQSAMDRYDIDDGGMQARFEAETARIIDAAMKS